MGAEQLDHERILDAGAHHEPDPRAIQQKIEAEQQHGDDADHLDAIERIDEEARN